MDADDLNQGDRCEYRIRHCESIEGRNFPGVRARQRQEPAAGRETIHDESDGDDGGRTEKIVSSLSNIFVKLDA